MVRKKREDPGFCLMGARTMLKHVTTLRKKIKKAEGGGDIEAVHQLRVASRRIRAEMPIFELCFKPKPYQKWRSATKGLTKALGEARDTDVQIEYLKSFLQTAQTDATPGVEALLGFEQKHRAELQERVEAWLDNLEKKGTLRKMRSKLDKLVQQFEDRGADVRTRASFAAGLAQVSVHTQELLALEGFVHREEAKTEHHALRIAAKHLRYTLEAFRPLFDDEIEEEMRVMKGLQDLLGEMHDCDVWTDTLPGMLSPVTATTRLEEAEVRPGLEAVAQDRATARQQLYRRFVLTWDTLRRERFFEKTTEKFQEALSQKELGSPIVGIMHRPAKLALISDVHGNLDALNAVMNDVQKEGIAVFLNMGDMVGYGAYPEEVVRKLRSDRVLSIAGNIDLKVLEFARASKKAKARSVKGAVVAVAARSLSEESLDFIASLPLEIRMDLCGRRLLMVHSSPADSDEHLTAETPDSRFEEIAQVADADIVLVGHSHQPLSRNVGRTMFINPGSVGRPADHDPRASYAILDTKDFSVQPRRVEYDVEAAAQAVIELGLSPEVADPFRHGLSSSEGLEESNKD